MSEKRECRICGRTMQYHPCGGWFCDHLEPIIDVRDARIAELVGLLGEVVEWLPFAGYDKLYNRINAALENNRGGI